MSKDGPPSGRMVFGYRQSKDAGVPYKAPRSSAEVNLETFVTAHPGLRARVVEMRKQGRRSDAILNELREEGWDGRFAVELWRDAEQERYVDCKHAEDQSKLEAHVAWGFERGVYRSAVLWELEPGATEWTQIRSWPRDEESRAGSEAG